ncbi:MAG: MbnP family protein [Bacteroidota bacterium]
MIYSKWLRLVALSVFALLSLSACDDDEGEIQADNEVGEFVIKFDNKVGSSEMRLSELSSTDYAYTTNSGQPFNLTLFGYYISKIKLEGPDGELYEDEMNVSPNPDEVEGYYHVLESNTPSQRITLENVPAGKYNKITFTVGIEEEGVQEGAAGGILDPAAGAWFWNWNAGYIGFAMEGGSPNSPQQFEDFGGGFFIPESAFQIHVGGWKDITPAEGEPQRFVNNNRTITLDFDSEVRVSESLRPEAHIVADALKALGDDINFEETFSVHAPFKGAAFANKLEDAFIFDHTHQ